MSLVVAILDPIPAYCRGMEAALGNSGFVTARNAKNSLLHETWDAALVTLRLSDDHDRVSLLRRTGRCELVVGLLPTPSPEAFRSAFRAGALSAVCWGATPEQIIRVLRAACDGEALIPTDVVGSLVLDQSSDSHWVTVEERNWLRQLGAGTTIIELAAAAGYSERAMYRLLHSVYEKMKVSNRMEAITLASRQGWL